MQIGVVYPQTEMETDPGAVAHYARAVEAMGFAFINAYDHVLGTDRLGATGNRRPYTLDSTFHEPLVLFSYLAALTSRIHFATTVMVLSQRQTALVAKQAACLDVLSNGRFRLGIGTGWNEVEYEALGMPFAGRGKVMEEQVEVLRELWTSRAVTFHGEHHTINEAGIWPLPARPIPVWFGGASDRALFNQPAKMGVLRRIARMGDGWIQQTMPRERIVELNGIFHELLREYGRDPASVAIETRLDLQPDDPESWARTLEGLGGTGITHVGVGTMGAGLAGVDAHLRRLEAFRAVVPAA